MAYRQLRTVLAEFLLSLQECRELATDAKAWSQPAAPGARPQISGRRRDSMTEMAFLRAFLAWEVFIEESFILYMLGQSPPRGRPPQRHAYPPKHSSAIEWVKEGRRYAAWTVASEVSQRAERFFRDGRPFASVLRGNQTVLEESRTIRNAIAHKSMTAHQTFETLARTKIGILPPTFSVGSFLGTNVPGTVPPVSFLESYIGKIDLAARQIVPS